MDTATAERAPSSSSVVPAGQLPRPRLLAVLLRDRDAAVAAATALVVVLLAVVRTIAAGRGWFSNDDLGEQGVAATYQWPSGSLLALPWNSHMQPVEWVLIWVFTHAAPLQFWPVVLSTALLVPVHGWATYLLLRRLFGSRAAIVPLVALATGSSITLAASLWWAVQIVQLPLLILSTLTTWAFLGYLGTRRRRHLLLTTSLYVGALLVSERALPLPLLLVLLQVGWFSGEGGFASRALNALRSSFRLWAVLGGVGVLYAGWYVSTAPSATDSGGSPRLFLRVVWEAVLHALAPALVGGPWTWRPIDDVANVANPGGPTRVLAVTVVLLLIAGSCAVHRRAGRAWGLLLLWLLVGSGLLTATRAPLIGQIIAREYRYFTELALVAPLAIGLATLQVRWRADDRATLVLERRTVPPAVAAALSQWRPLLDLVRRRSTMVMAALTAAFVAGSSMSVAAYDENWSSNSARTWMTAAQDELARHPGARIADTLVPAAVVPPVSGFYARTPVLLRPIAAPGRFLTSGSAGDELRAFDPQGRLQPVTVTGAYAAPGPVQGCGYLIASGTSLIPLVASTFEGHWLARIAYFTQQDRTARVTAGRTTTDVVLHSGLHVLFVVADGTVAGVTVSDVTGGGPVCVTEVQVGDAKAFGS